MRYLFLFLSHLTRIGFPHLGDQFLAQYYHNGDSQFEVEEL